ncbi:hypothetical protein L210DRAFT_3505622 [Boletus edulis BED1]|uniref:Uncharacterized protein n=1 Tax=Boletus edulis BED1 TaxID=1328754 RepID=A0AAD4BQ30_BOLED|nr:hypothetical protein L210DRAFT_3505622 [Boletus edulis BED1]
MELEAMRQTTDLTYEPTLPSSKAATDTNSDHFSAILQALQDYGFELQSFDNLTLEEYQLIAHERSNHIYPKSPLEPYHHPELDFSLLPNSSLKGKNRKSCIPDIHVDILPHFHGQLGETTTVWLGECGFSQSYRNMQDKLKRVTTENLTINTLFIIAIRELGKAKRRNIQSLHSLAMKPPHLPMEAFSSQVIFSIMTLKPIMVGDVKWTAIQSVNIYVFRRWLDRTFDFANRSENLLYLGIVVHNITKLFNTASGQLLDTIADIMELYDSDQAIIKHLHNQVTTVSFPIDWNQFLLDIQHGPSLMAFEHYKTWHIPQNLQSQLSLK